MDDADIAAESETRASLGPALKDPVTGMTREHLFACLDLSEQFYKCLEVAGPEMTRLKLTSLLKRVEAIIRNAENKSHEPAPEGT